MQSLVCVEYVVECQILFSVLNAAWAFRVQALMSVSSPCVVNNTTQICKLFQSLSSFIMYAEGLFVVQGNTHLHSLLYINF